MRVAVLGSMQLDGGGAGVRPRSRVVLAALIAEQGRALSADELAEAVWGDQLPGSWAKQLQYCVWDLRKALGADVVETVDGGYRLGTGGEDLDVTEFESLIERARGFAATGEADRAASTLTRALGLWRGRPFDNLDEWMPARHEAARLEELRRTAEEDLLDARLAAGDHRDVVAEAERRAAEEPLRERRWAQLAVAQYRSGNQAAGLRTLKKARDTLVDQLGIDPGAELVALEAAILHQDPALARAPSPVAADRCPYKGLAAFDADDSDVFFGREGDIAACLHRLDSVRLLVVAGPSGCGKSSLVRAGIVPVLAQRGLAVAMLVPGADPDGALSQALATAGGQPVVVVDQLEELFAGHQSTEAIRAFCSRLAQYATEQAQLIVTIRSDNLGRLGAEPALARLVEQGIHLVGPLHGDALRATIEGPAAAAGLRREPGRVDLLLRETEGEPAALPLLSHALAETWERRDGRVLTVEGYRATGEIRGAVARSAEQLYASLPADQQGRLRSLVLRLVVPSTDGEPVRAHLERRRLTTDAEREHLLDLLARARLITADETSVELAHEAVVRAWPRLRSWLDEDAAGQRLMHHLATAADDWDTLGRPASELYRGGRLESALEWRDAVRPDLTAVESDFIEASAAAAESESRRQTRQNRRLRWALAGAAALLVAAVAGGLVAVRQRQTARDQRRDAAISALVGDATSLRSNRRDLAALLAVEAYRLRPDAESESALFGTFTAAPGAEQVVRTGVSMDNRVRNADAVFLPDNHTVAFGDVYAGVHLVDLGTGEAATLPALSDRPSHSLLAVSPDGRYLATAWRQPLPEPELSILTVWDLETETRRFSPVEIPVRAGDLAISDDGSIVALGGGIEMQALTFDGATGAALAEAEPLVRPEDAGNQIVTAAVRFLPDGRLLVGSQAPVMRIIDPRSGEELERFDVPQESTHAFLGLAEDGQSIVGTGASHVRRSLAGDGPEWEGESDGQCNSYVVAESVGGLLCGEWSGRVIVYDLRTGAEIGARFDSQQGDACGLAVSPDGRRLVELAACSGDELMLVEWSLDGGGPVSKRLVATTGDRGVNQFGFGGTEALVAEYALDGDEEQGTHVLDTARGEEVATFEDVWGFVPSDDPRVAAVVYDDGESPPTFGLYDPERRAPAGPVIDPEMRIDGLWSDGRIVVVREEPDPLDVDKVRVFDLATGGGRPLELAGDGMWVLQDVVFGDDELYLQVYTERDGRQYNLIQRVDRESLQWLADAPVGDYRKIATNGTVLTAATVDGHVVELDPVSLDVIGAPFPGTNGQVGSMAIDSGGRRLMVRADDDSLRFYDIATRTQLGDPIDTDATFANAALRGDGMMAAAVTGTGIVVWDLDPAHWVDAACRLAGRNMTRDEWDRYLGDLADYRETSRWRASAGERGLVIRVISGSWDRRASPPMRGLRRATTGQEHHSNAPGSPTRCRLLQGTHSAGPGLSPASGSSCLCDAAITCGRSVEVASADQCSRRRHEGPRMLNTTALTSTSSRPSPSKLMTSMSWIATAMPNATAPHTAPPR